MVPSKSIWEGPPPEIGITGITALRPVFVLVVDASGEARWDCWYRGETGTIGSDSLRLLLGEDWQKSESVPDQDHPSPLLLPLPTWY